MELLYKSKFIYSAFLIAILFNINTYSQDGTIDLNFGNNGFVTTQIIPDNDLKNSTATGVVIQPDGKILAAGSYDNYGKNAVAVARYKEDGSIDQTFGENGIVRSYFAETHIVGAVNGLALQSDGRIIVTGYATSATDYDLALMRFDTDGTVDSTFGNNGRVLTQIGPSHDYAYDMIIQPDDKIVLTGATHNSLIIDGILVRYTPDGQLDNTFGNNGVVITDFTGGADDYRAIALQSNWKIVVGGYSNNTVTGRREFALAKYNSDGSLDNSFHEDGLMTFESLIGGVVSVKILNQNQILILGGTGGGWKVALAKVNADGTLDSNFGTNGMLQTNFVNSTSDNAVKLLVQEDNKFIVTGSSLISSGASVMSGQRFNADGSVDETFADNGAFFIDLTERGFSSSHSSVMANDGSIYVAGKTFTDKNINIFAILKLNNDSTPLVSVKDVIELPKDFKLEQNYPNPFNPVTTINYTIPTSEFGGQMAELVSLSIYDVLGNEVVRLVNEHQSPGSYQVTFNASNLSSGLYLYKLSTGNYSKTNKMMLLK
jgi:uncharacterized delta-60 repeat protein